MFNGAFLPLSNAQNVFFSAFDTTMRLSFGIVRCINLNFSIRDLFPFIVFAKSNRIFSSE